MIRFYFGLLYGIVGLLSLYSQKRNYYHSNIWWNEVNLKGKFRNPKLFYQVDFQLRTGSDATNKKEFERGNLFKNAQQLQFRPFIGYQITENVQFMLAPSLAPTWTNYRANSPRYSVEYRLTPQLVLTQKLSKVTLTHRYRFEIRKFGKSFDSENGFLQMFDRATYTYDESKSRYRFRYMFKLIYLLNNSKIEKGTMYLNFFDEFHVNLGRHVPSNQQIDQNRVNIGLGYRMGRDVRFEIGPFIQTALAANGTNTDVFNNHGIQFFIIFNDMKKLFKGEDQHVPLPAQDPVNGEVPVAE